MPLARGEQDHVAGPDLLDGAVCALSPATTGGYDQCLTEGMGMPGGSRAGSNVTMAPATRAGGFRWNRESTRPALKSSEVPWLEGSEPFLVAVRHAVFSSGAMRSQISVATCGAVTLLAGWKSDPVTKYFAEHYRLLFSICLWQHSQSARI